MLELHQMLADLDAVSVLQRGFADALIVDVGAVQRSEVFDNVMVLVP